MHRERERLQLPRLVEVVLMHGRERGGEQAGHTTGRGDGTVDSLAESTRSLRALLRGGCGGLERTLRQPSRFWQ